MNSSEYLLVALFLTIVAISIVICLIIYNNAKKHVLENSVAIKQITLLQNKYYFHSIKASHTYRKSQNSLAAFRRINYATELLNYVKSNQIFFSEQIRKATENEKNYNQYCSEFHYIQATQKNWNSKLKNNIENSIIERNKLLPVCSINIKIENVYISPKGRNRYYDSHTFWQTEIINTFSKIREQQTFEAKKQEERSKMSDSLRYDILKRDGFKCTICGASAQDGAKLHVDHIIPVSKGGRTIKSNLRTLCSDCNLGKSDKYDPNGIN